MSQVLLVTWSYRRAADNSAQRASTVGLMALWTAAVPSFPAAANQSGDKDQQLKQKSNYHHYIQLDAVFCPHQDHGDVRESLVGLADVGQARVIQQDLLQNERCNLQKQNNCTQDAG